MDSKTHRIAREDLGFLDTSFAHPVAAYEHYEPPIHYTLKTGDLGLLRRRFAQLKDLLLGGGFVGYVEAEYLAMDMDIESLSLEAKREWIPFTARKQALIPGSFRQSEIHVALRTGSTDAPICERMRSMGFFTAFMEKPAGLFSVFTLQGSVRQVREVLTPTITFLRAHGGFSDCSVKEERVIDWWASHANVTLPPVIAAIDFHSAVRSSRRQAHAG